jgi:hypothetical protein
MAGPERRMPKRKLVDMETVTLSTHPKFLALIERSRSQLKARGGIPSAEMRRRLGLTPRK